MSDLRSGGFLASLRSSPRKRRRFIWLAASLLVVAALLAVALIVPSTPGKKPPGPAPASEVPGGSGSPFETVLGIFLVVILLTVAFAIIRLVWRLRSGDMDEGAGSDGYTWRNPRRDLEEAIRAKPK